jgi:hypothetical protein
MCLTGEDCPLEDTSADYCWTTVIMIAIRSTNGGRSTHTGRRADRGGPQRRVSGQARQCTAQLSTVQCKSIVAGAVCSQCLHNSDFNQDYILPNHIISSIGLLPPSLPSPELVLQVSLGIKLQQQQQQQYSRWPRQCRVVISLVLTAPAPPLLALELLSHDVAHKLGVSLCMDLMVVVR